MKTSKELFAKYNETGEWSDWSAACRQRAAEEAQEMGLEKLEGLLDRARATVVDLEYLQECWTESEFNKANAPAR